MKKRSVDKNYFGSVFDWSVDTLCDLVTISTTKYTHLQKKLDHSTTKNKFPCP